MFFDSSLLSFMRVYFTYAVCTKIGTSAFVKTMYKILKGFRDISLFHISQNISKLSQNYLFADKFKRIGANVALETLIFLCFY